MNKTNNPRLTKNSQALRKGMTKQERRLWYDFLKTLPVTVKRQAVIGPYIVDFYIAEAKLVIELDGSQHYDDENIDTKRDAYLKSLGIDVRRYANSWVNKNFNNVCLDIWRHIPSLKDRE